MALGTGETPPERPTPPRPWVLLLVDDEPDVLMSVKQVIELSMHGTKVLTASTGRMGLDLLDSERIDAIIADFKMPGMDGIEFLYQARKRHPNVPRIMLTAFADDTLVQRAISEVFVDEFIPKTTAPEDFLDRIERFLDYHPKSPRIRTKDAT